MVAQGRPARRLSLATTMTDPEVADSRRHYRVASGLDALLAVALVLEDGRGLPAELVDLNASGACLRWPLATTPVLDLNDTVQLNFQA
jgi:hypothetical protein